MTEFVKYYTSHLKSGHKVIFEEKMTRLLLPLKNLIYIKFTYRMFNLKYEKTNDKKTRDFKLLAITEKYREYF